MRQTKKRRKRRCYTYAVSEASGITSPLFPAPNQQTRSSSSRPCRRRTNPKTLVPIEDRDAEPRHPERSGSARAFWIDQRVGVSETRHVIGKRILFGLAHASQGTRHFGRCEVAVQSRCFFDLAPQVGIVLAGDARHAIARLPATVGSVAGRTEVRIEFLPDPQVLARPFDGLRVPGERGQIRG